MHLSRCSRLQRPHCSRRRHRRHGRVSNPRCSPWFQPVSPKSSKGTMAGQSSSTSWPWPGRENARHSGHGRYREEFSEEDESVWNGGAVSQPETFVRGVEWWGKVCWVWRAAGNEWCHFIEFAIECEFFSFLTFSNFPFTSTLPISRTPSAGIYTQHPSLFCFIIFPQSQEIAISFLQRILPHLLILPPFLQPHTRHIISTSELEKMKPSAIIVNTARGAVIDEAALVKALDEGKISSVGLDVYEEEPKIHPGLVANERVTLLPHMGTWTSEVSSLSSSSSSLIFPINGRVGRVQLLRARGAPLLVLPDLKWNGLARYKDERKEKIR